LEEADVIVINKTDLLSDADHAALRDALQNAYPKAEIQSMSARTGEGVDAWYDLLTGAEIDNRQAPDVDYEVYAEGEALLGWLNAAARIDALEPLDGNALLRGIADQLQAMLAARGAEIAHLKMTLTPSEGSDIAVLNLVRGDGTPESLHQLQDDIQVGELIVNLRAEADPAFLRETVDSVLGGMLPESDVTIEHIEAFRPGKPTPTYRMALA
jgi:hypothetical protein